MQSNWSKRVNYFMVIFSCRSSTPKTTAETQNGASPDYVTLSTQATPSAKAAIETDVKCRVCGLPADAIFDPCGHVVACVECATMLRKCFRCKVKWSVLILQFMQITSVMLKLILLSHCCRIVHYLTPHWDYLGIIWYIYHRTSSVE